MLPGMAELTYQNPVWPGHFADPFVLRVGQVYYAYGTGPRDPRGHEIPVLRSTNLANWESIGGALTPLSNPKGVSYWAPEVVQRHGKFFLYYSASTIPSDEGHRLRVATSYDPGGPFMDSGNLLLPEQGFTIDGSPFIDPKDGQAYLFFATDFESDDPVGTGVCVVRLHENLMQTTGKVHVVVRATAPWQIYQTDRNYKGRMWPVWNCVEGPNVLFHEGKYYCLYSGGAWSSERYGVGFVQADHPLGPWHPTAISQGPTVLEGIPARIIGPGHNSLFRTPGGKLFMAYHAWDPAHTARRMFFDPLIWTPDGPKVDGPTDEKRTVRL